MKFCLQVFLFAVATFFLGEGFTLADSSNVFLRTVLQQWEKLLPVADVDKLPKQGEIDFLPIRGLILGQDQISVDNVMAKLEEKKINNDIDWKSKKKEWRLAHNEGHSAVSKLDPIRVVKGPDGYVILDGHHDLFLSLYVGADTIAANVEEDLSNMSREEFWKTLKDRKLVYLKAPLSQLIKRSPRISDVIDNPNRYLASLIALKVGTKEKHGDTEIVSVKHMGKPIWIKIDDSVNFIEFHIAKALSDAGIQYQSEWKKDVPKEVVEKIRAVLIEAQASGKYPRLEEIPILPSKDAHNNSKDLLKFINHFATESCANNFKKL